MACSAGEPAMPSELELEGQLQMEGQLQQQTCTSGMVAGSTEGLGLRPAWDLLLQRPEFAKQQKIVCQLLCTSRTMTEALHATAAGQVHCKVVGTSSEDLAAPVLTPLTVHSFCQWLARHAHAAP